MTSIDETRFRISALQPGVGSYSELREKTARIEQEIGWEGKKDKLFWRGAMGVGTADREAYLQVAGNQPWSDSKALDWHCEYMRAM